MFIKFKFSILISAFFLFAHFTRVFCIHKSTHELLHRFILINLTFYHTDYYDESDVEESVMESKPSLTQTSETCTTSWLRENNMDADITSYSNAALLKRSEYFFRVWYYAKSLFK